MQSIPELVQQLSDRYGLTPVMAAEIECYIGLAEITQETADAFFTPLAEQWNAEAIPVQRIEKERGQGQFEVVTEVMTPEWLVYSLQMIRYGIETRAAELGVSVSFAAKPYIAQPSSGLHLHLHLADAEGINAFHKTEEWTSDALRWSLGGLLKNLEAQLPIFFPAPRDYARLNDADHVPKIAGWGVNNRYCALRIPAIEDPYSKRIEHRVPSANTNPEAAIAAMLEAVLDGLDNQIEPPEQEFGKPTVGLLESLAAAAT